MFGLFTAAVISNSSRHSSRPHRRWWRLVTVEIRDAIASHCRDLLPNAAELQIWSHSSQPNLRWWRSVTDPRRDRLPLLRSPPRHRELQIWLAICAASDGGSQ
ncbi:hypothetical protein TIFTF001_047078 [Ficus carica]|uniref:Uncharacterized protein n=1 Tax=Ficus carica TaxID=3494 RepID=A0AA87Z1W2_FICCA|nr:hypothetical protein TIFTF001_047078 [Ficus carica]